MADPTIRTGERALALVALLAWAVLVGLLIVLLIDHVGFLVLGLGSLFVLLLGLWLAATERGRRRGVGLAATVVGIYGIVHALFVTTGGIWPFAAKATVLAVGFGLYYGLGTLALRGPTAPVPVEHTPPPRHPVMIANPKSGGGKVAQFDLVDRAHALGIETVMLEGELDLEDLARDAVAKGADCLAMAGGDGSQALVASIAVEAGIPYVCIPAGTRNHLALDLGLDRDDPTLALAAFGPDGVERHVDYATAADRFFVNNVSLGVYAEIVHEDGYRDAKVETTLDKLPEMLGSHAEPLDLAFDLPEGRPIDGAYLIQISNNPYDDSSLLRVGMRPRLDTGELGVIALWDNPDVGSAKLIAALTANQLARTDAFAAFTAREFTVRSASGTCRAGVDGEALELATPVRFRIHPGGLRVRVPAASLPTAHRRSEGRVTPSRLWQLATGHVATRGTD